MPNAKAKNTRQLLSTRAEVRSAVVEVASLATRSMAIFTHDLEPEIYDHDDFLETIKRLVLARSFARVRVLIVDPSRAMKHGNRFVTIGRRLNSYIEFRNVKPDYRDHPEAFCIADETALVYRSDAIRWEGMADTCEPAIARSYLNIFDEIWNACEVDPELRQMHL